MRRIDAITNKVQGGAILYRNREHLSLVIRAQQQVISKPILNVRPNGMQVIFIVVDNAKIIHIARIKPGANAVLNFVVQLMQIDIRHQLTGQVTNWNAELGIFSVGIDDCPDQVERSFAGDIPGQYPQDGRPVNTGEELGDVGLERIDAAMVAQRGAQKAFDPVRAGVRAAPWSAGVAVGDEARFPDGLDDVVNRVLQHPVAERQGRNLARLRQRYGEVAVGAGLVLFPDEIVLQGNQVAL
ncbi:hypothetical protein D3C76_770130 [compost metagenome]